MQVLGNDYNYIYLVINVCIIVYGNYEINKGISRVILRPLTTNLIKFVIIYKVYFLNLSLHNNGD